MRTSKQLVEQLVDRIGIALRRPLMYAGSAAGVDLILHELFALWGFAVDRENEFEQAWRDELELQNCDSANFSTRYQMDHPGATDRQTVEHVVQCWQKIANALGMGIEESTAEPLYGPRLQ